MDEKEALARALKLLGVPPEGITRIIESLATVSKPTFADNSVDPSGVVDKRPSVPRSTASPTAKPTPSKPKKRLEKASKKVDTSSQAPPAGFDPILARRQLGMQNDNIGLLNTLNRLYFNDLLPISRFTENRSMND